MHDSDSSSSNSSLYWRQAVRYTREQSDKANKSSREKAEATSGDNWSKSQKPKNTNTGKDAGTLDMEDKDKLAQEEGNTQGQEVKSLKQEERCVYKIKQEMCQNKTDT